jgi:TM2 domain-containing membrane protein YozV
MSNVFAEKQKDHLQAFFLSFMVPGFGQYYAGSPSSAKQYIITELAIWGGYYYFTSIKKSYREDYLAYAANHSGVNPQGHGSTYLNAMRAFDSSFDYNGYQLQIKESPNLYTGDLSWRWDSFESRQRFGKLRERELDYENYTKYCIAGMLLNHFLSGLNASKLVQKNNKTNTALTVNVFNDGLSAHYSRAF